MKQDGVSKHAVLEYAGNACCLTDSSLSAGTKYKQRKFLPLLKPGSRIQLNPMDISKPLGKTRATHLEVEEHFNILQAAATFGGHAHEAPFV